MYRRSLLCALGGAGAAGLATPGAAHPTPTAGPGEDDPSTGDYGPAGRLTLPGAHEAVVGPAGETAYVATGPGVAAVDVADPAAPALLAHRTDLLADREDGPLSMVWDLAVDGDRLLAAGPANPTGGLAGVVLFDLAGRVPEPVAGTVLDTPVHNCALADGVAYLTANGRPGSPLVTLDPETGRELGAWRLTDADPAWADTPRGLRPLHDVTVADDRAYLAHWDAGTWLVDVSDPADPRTVGQLRGRSPAALAAVSDPGRERLETPGNDHFVTVDESGTLLGVGAEAWDADDDGAGAPGGVTLYDIADPAAPERLARLAPPATDDPSPRGTLTTAHNFALADGRCYSAWYQGGLRVHDLRDPTAPREVAAWRDADRASLWTACPTAAGVVAPSTAALGSGEPALYAFPAPGGEDRTDRTTTPGAASPLGGTGLLALAGAGLAALWRARRAE